MHTSPSHHKRHFGGARLSALLLLLGVAGGLVAYRHFFNRAGEAAIQLIPADAMMVLTVDANPSPQQTITFKRIEDALKREQADVQFDKAITSVLQNSPVGKEIRPYLRRNMALALLKANGQGTTGTPDAVVLLAVTEPGHVKEILAKYGRQNTQDGVEYYQLQQQNTDAAVIGDYLALSDKPAVLARVESVRSGATESVAHLPEYQQARTALPSDANLMVFVSPRALAEAQERGKAAGIANPWQNTRWMAFGMTVRERGLDAVWQMPMDAQAVPGAQNLSSVAPLNDETFKRLPAGAYGLMAFSQPGKYWNWIEDSTKNDPKASQSLNDGVAAFEKETQMSVPRDIVPGLQGHLVLAVYPDATSPQAGVDGLMVLDDANGADASALADKIRNYVERASAKDGKGVRFVSEQRNGATIWALDDSTQDRMARSLGDAASSAGSLFGGGPGAGASSFSPPPSGNLSLNGSDGSRMDLKGNGLSMRGADGSRVDLNGSNFSAYGKDGSRVGMNGNRVTFQGNGGSVAFNNAQGGTAVSAPPTPPASPLTNALRKKTVVYAQVGHTVLMASSRAMLDQALAVYTSGKGTLADDPAYAQMHALLQPGSQSALMVNLPGIMEALRPSLVKWMANSHSGITPEDVTQMFGAIRTTGIVGSSSYDGKVMSGRFFLPLDYERLIHVFGAIGK